MNDPPAMSYAELTEAFLAKGDLVEKLFIREDMHAATIDGLVDEVAQLKADLLAKDAEIKRLVEDCDHAN